ncbi:hypothetical protein SAZ89_09220 [Limosilactobacillus reuteri]|nr:hypothetical protein [Limosilactobacillus reuteri]
MNKELKSLLFISTGLFLIFVLIFNLYTYNAASFIPQARKTSQILSQNRLRAPNIHRSSENWAYPKIGNVPIELIAIKQAKRILVINSNKRQVIYIIHAQINLPAQKILSAYFTLGGSKFIILMVPSKPSLRIG